MNRNRIDGYRMVRANAIDTFERRVNRALEEGYQPIDIDGVIVGSDDYGSRFVMEMAIFRDDRAMMDDAPEIDIRDALRGEPMNVPTPLNTRHEATVNEVDEDVMVEPTNPWRTDGDNFVEETEDEEVLSVNQLNRLGVAQATPVHTEAVEVRADGEVPQALRNAVQEMRRTQMETRGEVVEQMPAEEETGFSV